MYALQFLDAATTTHPNAQAELERLHAIIPSDGRLHVAGGLDHEFVGPLDFVPLPERPLRRLFDAAIVVDELDRLETSQQEDGGWPIEWDSYSPIAALEWRGWLTVRAMTIMHKNGRLPLVG